MIKNVCFVVVTCLISSQAAYSADKPWKLPKRYPAQIEGTEVLTYKTVAELELKLYVVKPSEHKAKDSRPAIVFFFGGAWRGGTPEQFTKQCQYFASRGMVAIAADYRVFSRHRSTVVQSVSDAKSAIRWVRQHADELGIDPERIVASGGSAGGHLAVVTGIVPGFEETDEDASISSKPNAMVLFNPVMAMAPIDGGDHPHGERAAEIARRIGDDPLKVSPYHHVQKDQPPAIVFFGLNDGLLASARQFEKVSLAAGNRCELMIWENCGHGFFNYGRYKNRTFIETVEAADKFLASLGYLEGEPTVREMTKIPNPKPKAERR